MFSCRGKKALVRFDSEKQQWSEETGHTPPAGAIIPYFSDCRG